MKTIEIEAENMLAAAGAIPEGVPIVMLNLLRYKEHADYGERADMTPCSGREAYYHRYVPAFNQLATPGIKLIWLGSVLARVVGPFDEQWDDAALVEYPSFAAFRDLAESARYREEASHHRLAALEDWRLIATVKATLPG